MNVQQWHQRRTKYMAKTIEEGPEYRDLADDTPFFQRVHEQAIRELLDKLETIQARLDKLEVRK